MSHTHGGPTHWFLTFGPMSSRSLKWWTHLNLCPLLWAYMDYLDCFFRFSKFKKISHKCSMQTFILQGYLLHPATQRPQPSFTLFKNCVLYWTIGYRLDVISQMEIALIVSNFEHFFIFFLLSFCSKTNFGLTPLIITKSSVLKKKKKKKFEQNTSSV